MYPHKAVPLSVCDVNKQEIIELLQSIIDLLNKSVDLQYCLLPLTGLTPYFENMATLYPNTDYAQCGTLVQLNDKLIHKISDLNGDLDSYVLKSVFDVVKTAVNIAIEDWPAAAGSVWNVIQDIYHIIGRATSTRAQTKGQTISIEERLSAMEEFLKKEFGYNPPN